MARTPPEWIGKTDDTKIPPRVSARVFDRANGICHCCNLPIKVPFETWDADHRIALINGGENRESNLAPAHSHCHIKKTRQDVAEKAKVASVRGKHIGTKRPSSKLAGNKQPKPPMTKIVERSRPFYVSAQSQESRT